MELQSTENLLSQVEELKDRLAEAEQLIEAIKAGEVDAFAVNKNDRHEVFTLHSGDYAYRVLVENFSEGALNLSEDGLIVYTNTSFHETLKLTYEKVIGNTIFQFIHPESKEAFAELFRKGIAGQSKGEINLVAAGETFPVHVSLTSLYPTLPTVGMIVYDLRERKVHEQTLVQKKELEIAKKVIEESEKQVRHLKDQLDLSISAGNIGIWNLNVKNNHLHWSKEQCELYGITEKEFGQTPEAFWKFVNPEDLRRLETDSEKNFKSQKSDLTHQFRIARADGIERWIESRIRTQYDAEGRPEFITGINIDITDEKLFAQELEEKVIERTAEISQQKDFIETIINSTPDLVSAYDTETRIIAFSKSCEDFFKIKREDVIGKIFTDVFPSAKGSAGEKDLLRALQGETIHNTIYHSSVTGKYYENYISPLKDESGKIYGAVAISHDISENLQANERIKQSEEKFNKLFSASPLGLVLSEIPSGKIVDVNKIYSETTGYSIQECIGKTSVELNLLDKDNREKIIDELDKNGSVKNVQVSLHTKSGKIIPVLKSIETISIGDKKYFLSAIVDITQRRNAELQVEEKNIELQKMNKELEAFTYISSHDLQEPLRKIQLFSGRIIATEKEQLSDTAKDYFNRMTDAAVRMQTLIQDLLRFSRIATTERKFEITDLNKIVDEVKAELQEVIETKRATIILGEMCKVKIIPFLFRQLIHNLISNSLKFSKPDIPPHITITGKIIPQRQSLIFGGNSACHITYTDNGIGFEPQFSEKIFQVFQKLHGKEQYAGTGIGLAIVKKIVENHNGMITAESELGMGTTFNIYIPTDIM